LLGAFDSGTVSPGTAVAEAGATVVTGGTEVMPGGTDDFTVVLA
jgi:hypothetical protein